MASQLLAPENLAFIIIFLGFALICIGMFLSSRDRPEGGIESKRETKAIVFLGPIPLVWGFSRRTQVILATVAISIFIIWLLFTF